MNYFEHTVITNKAIPEEWRSQASQEELREFLQANWEQRNALYYDGDVSSRQQFIEFIGAQRIKTKNYVGTITFKGKQLNIFPKVFKLDEYEQDATDLEMDFLMKNLVRWIEYSTKFDYPYINVSAGLEDSNDLVELFISLYVRYVKNALDRGLYFRYEEQEDDLTTIRGQIDIKDYVMRKIPNGNVGKFRCKYSTFEFDNLLNRVIKYTLKFISKLHKTSNINQKIIRNLLTKLGDVEDAKCVPSDCDRIQLSKMQSNYKVIVSMSKMFLLNDVTNYGIENQESFCFLFPAELLFEGFIGGFMQHIFKGTAKVKTQVKETLAEKGYLGNREVAVRASIRPDIIVEHPTNGIVILDTKYKEVGRLESWVFTKRLAEEINQGDIYQVLVYAMKNKREKVYLLYPQFKSEEPETDIFKLPVAMPSNDGEEYVIEVNFVRVPFVFEEDEEKTKENLKQVLLKIFE